MKKLICGLLLVALMFALMVNVAADEMIEENNSVFLQMTDEECMAFLKSKGVEFPHRENDFAFWGPIVKKMIATVENNPEHTFTYNYTRMQAFADAIKDAVNNYYGIKMMRSDRSAASTYASIIGELKYSTVVGSWKDEYLSYNCYGYALGTNVLADPGYYSNKTLEDLTSVSAIAELVIADLKAMGYADAAEWDPSNDCEGGNVIALRISSGVDYHFMKLNRNEDTWYHKPGQTAILKYNHTPTVVLPWTNEAFSYLGYHDATITYDSTIYYIGYGFDHSYQYEYCGGSQHILTCTTCGHRTGSWDWCTKRNDMCIICGHDFSGIQFMSFVTK